MSQSLVNQFIDRRKSGEKLGTALRESIFQAKPPPIDFDDDLESKKEPFKLWKINMRPLMDDEPMYVTTEMFLHRL
jgi:hypothetical protein